MYKIKTINKISKQGLENFSADSYQYADEIDDPDAIIVRSQDLKEMEFSASLKVIARAGAGYNNIPVERCSEKGIVVLNTPGANANAVKEMVLLGLLLSGRDVYSGISWVKSIAGEPEVGKAVEKNKSSFKGPEVKGKKLGVIGLGAIGVMVANDAISLGMQVSGFDPFISVDSAWGLSRDVKKSLNLESLLSDSDYISLHVPLNDETRGMINKDKIRLLKKGMRILNFARGELVEDDAIKEAISQGTVSYYVTDFPSSELLKIDNVIPIPHLGASTPESEENCAVMAVNQIRQYLENGNIVNSVNYPDCMLPSTGQKRITIANKNVPNMIGQITPILAQSGINISDMLNKSKGDYAYNIIDIDDGYDDSIIEKLKGIKGVVMVRVI